MNTRWIVLLAAPLAWMASVLAGCRDAPAGRTLGDARAADTRAAVPSSSPPPSAASPLPPPSGASPPPPPSPASLPALAGDWLESLPLAGFGDARVSVPLGATSPRPVMLGVHGRGDRPEWACGEWRGVTDGFPFILCPHGVPERAAPGQGLAFAGAERTRREIDAGLEALRARYGRHVAEGPMIYAGFSLGAFLGVRIVAADPASFPVAVLGEGGQSTWTPDLAAAFKRGGGRRVLFVCSTASCEAAVPPALASLRREEVETKMVSAGHIGHLVDDRVVAVLRKEWPWVVGGLAGVSSAW